VQLRIGRFNHHFDAWRLSGGSSPRKANFLQLVSRAMVGLDLEAVRKITLRFEGYASTVCRATCGRCGADTTQGGALLLLRLQQVGRHITRNQVRSAHATHNRIDLEYVRGVENSAW
jgi:hypothetical protein